MKRKGCLGWSFDFRLRITMGILQICTFIGGLMSGITLGWVSVDFNNCLLYTSMSVKVATNTSKITVTLDNDNTHWTSQTTCTYVTYTGICAAIYALIWFWFYILITDWGNKLRVQGPPPDLGLVAPTLFISICLFVCCLAAAGQVTVGTQKWCDSIEDSLQVTNNISPDILLAGFCGSVFVVCSCYNGLSCFHHYGSCKVRDHNKWRQIHKHPKSVQFQVSNCKKHAITRVNKQVGAWLVVLTLLLQVITNTVRAKMFSIGYFFFDGDNEKTISTNGTKPEMPKYLPVNTQTDPLDILVPPTDTPVKAETFPIVVFRPVTPEEHIADIHLLPSGDDAVYTDEPTCKVLVRQSKVQSKDNESESDVVL